MGFFESCPKRCSNGRAPGPGGIPNKLIKHLPSLFLDLLYTQFQVCWKSGFTPQDWKDSTTILLHKKGPITDPQNYRPVGLQQSLSKLWTRTVTAILQNYGEQYSLLSHSQEGFRPGRNCARQLQMLTSVLEDAKFHSQDVVNLLSIDFICAFNTIDHTRLFDSLATWIPNGRYAGHSRDVWQRFHKSHMRSRYLPPYSNPERHN